MNTEQKADEVFIQSKLLSSLTVIEEKASRIVDVLLCVAQYCRPYEENDNVYCTLDEHKRRHYSRELLPTWGSLTAGQLGLMRFTRCKLPPI